MPALASPASFAVLDVDMADLARRAGVSSWLSHKLWNSGHDGPSRPAGVWLDSQCLRGSSVRRASQRAANGPTAHDHSPILDQIAFAWFVVVIGYRLVSERGPFRRRSIVAAVREAFALDAQYGRARKSHVGWHRAEQPQPGQRVLRVDIGARHWRPHRFGRIGRSGAGFPGAGPVRGEVLFHAMGNQGAPAHRDFRHAFFKFAWAFRVSHYASIMIGATPIATGDNSRECEDHAERTAHLLSIAGEHANRGLRAYYYAIAALAWFFHPVLLIIATTWVVLILARRDLFSRSRSLLAGD